MRRRGREAKCQPARQQPERQRPALQQPAPQQPELQQPALQRPAPQQPARQQPAPQQPAPQQPERQRPEPQQPELQRPARHNRQLEQSRAVGRNTQTKGGREHSEAQDCRAGVGIARLVLGQVSQTARPDETVGAGCAEALRERGRRRAGDIA